MLKYMRHPEHGVTTVYDEPTYQLNLKHGWEGFIPKGHPMPKGGWTDASPEFKARMEAAKEFGASDPVAYSPQQPEPPAPEDPMDAPALEDIPVSLETPRRGRPRKL